MLIYYREYEVEYIDDNEALRLLRSTDSQEIKDLLSMADQVREHTVRKQVCVHGLIEFSNICRSHCLYCGIRAENKKPRRYRLPVETIAEIAVTAANVHGYKMLVLQSGEDSWYDVDRLAWLMKKIRAKSKVLIFLSIGERDRETYEALHRAGARGMLFRFETSDPDLYQKMHLGSTLYGRLEHIREMKRIGYFVATGSLIGLPGQTTESLVRDLYLIRDLKPMMATIGPFIPSTCTPLAKERAGSVDTTLRMIALLRLIYPKVRIPITTALEKLGGPNVRSRALTGGGNAFMLNLTPPDVRMHYEIYDNKNSAASHLHNEESVRRLTKLIESEGRHICKGFGKDFTIGAKDLDDYCTFNEDQRTGGKTNE